MSFGYAADNGEAKARGIVLGGEERLEHAATNLIGETGSAVGDFQFKAVRTAVGSDN